MHRQKVRFFCYKESIDDDWEYIKQKSIFQCTPKKEKSSIHNSGKKDLSRKRKFWKTINP